MNKMNINFYPRVIIGNASLCDTGEIKWEIRDKLLTT